MGWNTPDDCPWPSDMDYYDAKRGPMDRPEPDEDDEDGPHYFGCICADCSGAELTAGND